MEKRQEQLLESIILHHIETAEPVGSKSVAGSRFFNLSPATIRNEMAVLENDGYIFQPHTSAGRIPTEKGYQYYIKHLLSGKELDKKSKSGLLTAQKNGKKDLAKKLAEFSRLAVFLGFSDSNFFYTGLANLFSQPEFSQRERVYNISEVVDHLDEAINKIFNDINSEPEIFLGKNNPFGSFCGTICVKYRSKNENGILGLLGPVRMNYKKNLALIKYSSELMESL
ncbi:hypothetical protein C4569_01765 [Candidatus Parcubacteria bacterium]|nr:MAG: hypothetical protein C4569_01765 [Candidatus Parcubacteria bacterium]